MVGDQLGPGRQAADMSSGEFTDKGGSQDEHFGVRMLGEAQDIMNCDKDVMLIIKDFPFPVLKVRAGQCIQLRD